MEVLRFFLWGGGGRMLVELVSLFFCAGVVLFVVVMLLCLFRIFRLRAKMIKGGVFRMCKCFS
uniref:Putative ovule protein n=1 Tax=Solanum chacoense TaxID=4108 RepID=A0A0V0HFB0_SOLCH